MTVCTKCHDAGERSTVRRDPVQPDRQPDREPCDDYYDEDGRSHMHDPNWRALGYKCSTGHRWVLTYRNGCKACGTADEDRISYLEAGVPS